MDDWDRWRGGIDTRVRSMEDGVRAIEATMRDLDRGVTRLHGRLNGLQREVGDCRKEIREAAGLIDKGREDAVRDLKDTISARDAEGHAWRLTKFQVFVAAGIAAVVGLMIAVLQLAIAGHLG